MCQSPALPPTTRAAGRVPVPLCEGPSSWPPSSTHRTGSGNFIHRKHRARHVVLALFCFVLRFHLLGRERKSWEGGGHTEAEGERQSQADSSLRVEPDTGLDPMTLTSRPEPKPRVGCSTDQVTCPHPAINSSYNPSEWFYM